MNEYKRKVQFNFYIVENGTPVRYWLYGEIDYETRDLLYVKLDTVRHPNINIASMNGISWPIQRRDVIVRFNHASELTWEP